MTAMQERELVCERVREMTRRYFLGVGGSGLGMAALAQLLAADDAPAVNPLAPKPPHFPATARACIFIFLEGGPSQIDLFDPKPKLNALDGKFAKHGQSGMEFSDLLPNLARCADDLLMVRSMHTDQFNHHPAQLVLHCGRPFFGLPTAGAWLTYGLGSESQNLPGYVVLSAGRGTSGGASLWQSGFLPSVYAGVVFRSQGEPVLNLTNPPGLPPELQRRGLDALREMNDARYRQVHDPEIASRLASYELAFRMQAAAPELADLAGESRSTLEAYGVGRPDPPTS